MTRKNNPTKTGTNWLYLVAGSVLMIALLVGSFYFSYNFLNSRWVQGMAIDQQGNLYLAEGEFAHVEKYTPDGELLMTFGNEGRGDGQFDKIYGPHSTAVDRQGNVYAAQGERHNRIQKFDVKGNFRLQWQPAGQAEKVVVDSQDNVYVLVNAAPYIHKYDGNGQELLAFGTVGEEPGQLGENSYKALAVDSQDNVYVLDTQIRQVVKYNSQGRFLTRWANIPYNWVPVIAVDHQGSVYVTSGDDYKIYKYSSQGQPLLSWGGQDEKEGQFKYPVRQIVVDKQDNLYTINPGSGPEIVQKFDSQGRFLARWTTGFPNWLQTVFNLILILPGVAIGLLIRKAFIFPKPTEETLAGVTLPNYVSAAALHNDIYFDRLDLQKIKSQANSSEWKKGIGLGCALPLVLGLPLVIIALVVITVVNSDSMIWNLLIVMGTAILIFGAIAAVVAPKEIKKVKEQNNRLETIWKQAHSILPPANRPLIMIGSPGYNNLWWWLLIMLSPNLFLLLGGGGAINLWFQGWPSYLVESLVAVEITALILLGLVVFNALTRPIAGVVKLNRIEMLSLAGYLVRYIGIFIALTIGLGVLESWINGTLAGPTEGHVIVVVTPLSMIFPIVKYGYLALGLVFVPLQWIFVPFNRCEYDEALRRVNFLRRCANTITLRQIQIDILRRSGRLVEAEYLIQEGLSGQVARQQASLGALLETLALVKMYQGRYAESLYFMEKSIELRPTTKVGLSNLAEIYLWVGAYPARALYLMNEARKDSDLWLSSWLLPYNVGDRYINRAWALARMGQYAEAQQLTQTALKKAGHKFKPGISSIHFRAAKIMELCHNETAAAEHYQQAYWLDPTGYYGKQVIPLLLTGDSTSSINRFWDF